MPDQYLKRVSVFVSHSHDESELALALSNLLEKVSQGMINCWLSSDQSPDGGIPPGMKWSEVILAKIKETDFTIALLSSRSLTRPWVLWECGIASGIHGETGIIPVLYSLSLSEFKSPLDVYEAYEVDKIDGIQALCGKLVTAAGLSWYPDNFEVPFADYSKKVTFFKPPKLPSSEVIAANIRKIEKLDESGRSHELEALEELLRSAYGAETSIDYQIHDLLSEAFLRDNKPKLALDQVEKGLNCEPDDISFLHRKGLALLELDRAEDCKHVVDLLTNQDPTLAHNTEIAGLKGRMFRQMNDLTKALEAYQVAFEKDSNSYYCGENVVNLLIELNKWEEARSTTKAVLLACNELQQYGKSSFWLDFTKGKMHLIGKDIEGAINSYGAGLERIPAPGPRERISALRSIERLVNSKYETQEYVQPILDLLSMENKEKGNE